MSTLFNIGNKIVSSDTDLTPLSFSPTLYVKPPQGDEELGESGALYTFNPANGFNFSVQRPSGTDSGKKYVLGKDGLISEVAQNTPAFEYNPDGSYKGVLVEPGSTNNILRSNTFSDGYWRKENLTLSSESNSKFGTIHKVTDSNDGSDTYHFLGRIQNIVSTGTYNRSVFVKKGTLTRVIVNTAGVISPDESTGATGRVLVDLTDGSILNSRNADNIIVRNYGDGWYRISYSRTIENATLDVRFSIILCSNNATDAIIDQTYQGDGTGYLYVFGAQLESGSIATSYIPTTTLAVTRVADDISLTGASSLIGQTEGTLFVEVDWRLVGGGDQRLLDCHDGTSTNRLFASRRNVNNTIRLEVVSGGTQDVDMADAYSPNTGIKKLAFAYKTGDSKIFLDGSEIAYNTSTINAFTSPLNNIEFGQSYISTVQANMWIRAVALYDKRLTDTELAKLTSL